MTFDPSRFGKWAHKAIQMDAGLMEKAKKVMALYIRGATEGERNAAYSRLIEICKRSNITPEMFIKAMAANVDRK